MIVFGQNKFIERQIKAAFLRQACEEQWRAKGLASALRIARWIWSRQTLQPRKR